MSIYLKQIEQLVALQRVDCELIELDLELQNAPKEVEKLEGEYAAKESVINQYQEKISHLSAQDKRISSEIEEDTLKIKKSKNKLMMVSNTKEYHAMMREMDNLEKLNRTREEERMAVVEELQRQQESLGEIQKDANLIKEDLDVKRANLQERVKESEAQLAELNTLRESLCVDVPKPVLSRYEFIRSRLDSPVIVPVANGICDGCHIAIPPQSFNELQKGQQILSCPNCQRLIYWSEHFTDKSAKNKKAAEEEQEVPFAEDE